MAIVQATFLEQLDPRLSVLRIQNDVPTDLIYAPHWSAVYAHLGDDLFEGLVADVKADRFMPSLPITLETPKRNGLTRPGTILEPSARLLYQLLTDAVALAGEQQVDRARVFSHQLLDPDPAGEMFKKTSDCYAEFTQTIKFNCLVSNFVLQTDISCYFERIYHHNLINFLGAAGAPETAVRALEKLLLVFTERDSHGIIQGVAPSDFLGNVYLCPLDAQLAVKEIPSARYVDDICLFFQSPEDAKKTLVELCQHLRREGLSLNDSKTKLFPVEQFQNEDTAILELFQQARNELTSPAFEDIDVHYGFISEWAIFETEPEPAQQIDLDLQAVRKLYSERHDKPLYADSIDKFCLPAFSAVGDGLAIADCFGGIIEKPHLANVYCNYLSCFAPSNSDVSSALVELLASGRLIYESQKMWILAALMTCQNADGSAVDECLRLMSSQSSEPVRALACIFACAHGSAAQRRIVKQHYSNEQSQYVRGAILYAARYFPKNERETCVNSWGAHSTTNSLIAKTVKKLSQQPVLI